ncbi:hypothetical protein BDR26DRAFT_863152 [Obelidium mucronatum]|nr:hypothetical protein BDR26DRAFT_863152 [Obelidium mucronatum]
MVQPGLTNTPHLPRHFVQIKESSSSPSGKSVVFTVWTWFTHLLAGFLFGFALEKAKVYLPSVIIGQMRWEQYSMLIVFMTATLVGLLAVSILEKLGIYKRSAKPPLAFLGENYFRGFGNNIIGGLLIGFGMSLSGACPGTILVQIGVGVPTTPYTLIGTLLGSLSYGYLHKFATSRASKFGTKKPVETLDSPSFSALAIACVACLAGFPLLWYGTTRIPWRSQFQQDMITDFLRAPAARPEVVSNPFQNIGDVELDFTQPAWSPFVSGLAIGGTQIISILITGSVIGASSVFPYIGAVIMTRLDRRWEKTAPFYKDYRDMSSSFRFSVGMVFGGLCSALTSGLVYGAGLLFTPAQVSRLIGGGILLVYGSRIAGGCTSGHGLSGMAQLSVASFITVAFMFLGGTLMAFLVGPI